MNIVNLLKTQIKTKIKTKVIIAVIILISIAAVSNIIYKHYSSISVIDTIDAINIDNVNAPSDETDVQIIKNNDAVDPELINTKATTIDDKSAEKSPKKDLSIKSSNTIPKKVLALAITAYKKADDKDLVDNHKLTIIDYSQPSSKKRMWVIDMDKKKVDLNTYVSHGAKSGGAMANDFSNKLESHKSSLGVMKTGKIYVGKRGKSLYLHGLEKNINDNVYKRHVVIHGATYVNERKAKSAGQVGKSFGCPAVDTKVAKILINEIAGGSIVFAYYPNGNWLSHSSFL